MDEEKTALEMKRPLVEPTSDALTGAIQEAPLVSASRQEPEVWVEADLQTELEGSVEKCCDAVHATDAAAAEAPSIVAETTSVLVLDVEKVPCDDGQFSKEVASPPMKVSLCSDLPDEETKDLQMAADSLKAAVAQEAFQEVPGAEAAECASQRMASVLEDAVESGDAAEEMVGPKLCKSEVHAAAAPAAAAGAELCPPLPASAAAASAAAAVEMVRKALGDELQAVREELRAVREELRTGQAEERSRWEAQEERESLRKKQGAAMGSDVTQELPESSRLAQASVRQDGDDEDSNGSEIFHGAGLRQHNAGIQGCGYTSLVERIDEEDAATLPSDAEPPRAAADAAAAAQGPPWRTTCVALAVLGALDAWILMVAKPKFHNPDPKDPHKVQPWEPYVVLNSVAVAMYLMALGLPADLLLFGISSLFCIAGIITCEELLGGLGNSGVVAVASLCIVSKALDRTKALKGPLGKFLGQPKTIWEGMLRMAFPVVLLGTVINNTPLVAVMIPIVKDWTTQNRMQASHFMMPLSFITMLSACITTMGSSTNLLAVQLVPEAHIAFFDLAPAGFLVMAVGVGYCAILGPLILPATSSGSGPEAKAGRLPALSDQALALAAGLELEPDPEEGLQPSLQRYTVYFELGNDGPLLGRSAEDSGILKALQSPASVRVLQGSAARFEAGDKLAAINATAEEIGSLAAVPGFNLVGLGASYRSLAHRQRHESSMSEEPPRSRRFSLPVRKWVAASMQGGWKPSERALYEVVVPPGGLLRHGTRRGSVIGKLTMRDLQAPLSDWNCTLIAMQGMHPTSNKMMNLSGGEILLVQAVSANFAEESSQAFRLVLPVPDGTAPVNIVMSPLDPWRPLLSVIGLALCVGLSAFEISPLPPTAILVGLVTVVLGTLTTNDLYGAINGPVLLTVAGSFGVGAAFAKTGVASCLASAVLTLVEDSGPVAVLGAVVMLALMLGVIVSNNTTVILLAPMVRDICDRQGMDLKVAMLAVIYAANLSFATPFSYQTNMMVMPHGQYGFMDYVKFGVPMMLLCGAVALVATIAIWGTEAPADATA